MKYSSQGSIVLGDVPPSEDTSQLPVSCSGRAECPSLIDPKAHSAGGNLDMSVHGRSSLPRVVGKQVGFQRPDFITAYFSECSAEHFI